MGREHIGADKSTTDDASMVVLGDDVDDVSEEKDELFFLCDLLRHAGGVRGDDGVYPARPSALYTPTGPLGRSVASVDLKQPS
ncbi:hypothetical protein THAOC_34206, partial [Thalassiosira oceanica]